MNDFALDSLENNDGPLRNDNSVDDVQTERQLDLDKKMKYMRSAIDSIKKAMPKLNYVRSVSSLSSTQSIYSFFQSRSSMFRISTRTSMKKISKIL